MLKLDRMELHGFKSFNERTEILFDQGVTAVVGPNGCGKSNILDAMSWVLGEQSPKMLRGAAMSDLIFSGSQTRRPLGMAEVTLKLRATNGDLPDGQSHVSVTRRLLRSGESGYLMNGSACRLKDIQDVLYGSGLGVRAYSFIEQGRIGAILQAKPFDRRALIEEAAGITKFRNKKREAQLKLDAAESNLTRVRDIIAEVKKQMSTLKRQAAKARRFEKVRIELRATLRELYARDYEELRAKAHDAIERFRVESERRRALTEAVASAEAEVESLRAGIDKQESAVRGSAGTLHECEIEVDRNRSLIVNGRERLEELEERGRELVEGLAASRARHAELLAELDKKRSELVSASGREVQARERLASQREEREAAEAAAIAADAQLEAYRGELLAAVQASAQAGNAADSRADLVRRMSVELERLRVSEAEFSVAEQRTVRTALGFRDALAAIESQVAELGNSVRSGFEQAQELAIRRDAARATAEEARQALHLKEERSRALEQIIVAAEDAGEATAAVAGTLGSRAHGLVADVLRAEASYESAVGAALEPVLGALILTDPEAAEEALALAAAGELGALRVLLFDRPVVETPHPEVTQAVGEIGARGVLSDYVSLDSGVGGALAPLLARTILVERLGDAMRLRPDYPGLNFVTMSGEVVGSDGLLRAGARSGPGFLAVRREQRELVAALESELEGVAAAEATLAQLQVDADDAEAAARAAVGSLHEAEKELLEARHRAEAAAEERRKNGEQLQLVTIESERAERSLAETRELLAEECEAKASAEAARAELDVAIAGQRSQLEESRRTASQAAGFELAAEAEFARSEEAHKALLAQIARLDTGVRERAAEMAALESDQSVSAARGAALEREVATAEEALTGLFADVAALKDRLRTEEDLARSLRHDLQQREAGLKESRRESEVQRERVQTIEIERTRVDGELVRLAERSREDLGEEPSELRESAAVEKEASAAARALDAEFEGEDADADGRDAADADSADGVSAGDGDDQPAAELHDWALGQELTAIPLGELRARAMALKAKIARLGPVNELAIQEFSELRERDEFLGGQVGDIEESIESLVSTINRINRTTRERFRETFDEVNRNFQEIFAHLFGGGRAELRLTDEDNLLETGIDIVAQPPGKRLQNILLLSGGEKALTAISLLFALFQYKPSPFCILDEVDAPLDEKNIDRFANLLRTMSTGTQFILITHSPRTMKVADTLYGVTMEEPGVSRLVSVSFGDADA